MWIAPLVGYCHDYQGASSDTIPAAVYDTASKTMLLYPPQILHIDNALTGYMKVLDDYYRITQIRDSLEVIQAKKYAALADKNSNYRAMIDTLSSKTEIYEGISVLYEELLVERDSLYNITQGRFTETIEKERKKFKGGFFKVLGDILENLLYVGGGVLLAQIGR